MDIYCVYIYIIILNTQFIPSEFDSGKVRQLAVRVQQLLICEPLSNSTKYIPLPHAHSCFINSASAFIALYSDAKCIDSAFDVVKEKSREAVMLGGLQPNQSYILTASGPWQVVRENMGQQFYRVTQV